MEDLTRDVAAVKVAIKHLSPNDRAQLIAMLLYYRDDGAMFSPQIGPAPRSYYAEWYGVLARTRAEAAP